MEILKEDKYYAPIALFVYNRPSHTQKTVEALKANELAHESDLFIFSDGPKGKEDLPAVNKVRNYITKIDGFRSIHIRERSINYGLAKSIILGVTEIVNQFKRIIVLEDDLVTSPFFLRYMNDALNLYANEERVICIHGYLYPIKIELPETFFIKGADCWGWGTWERGWDLFEVDGQKLLHKLKAKKLTREFDFNNSFPYTRMLEDQIAGKNDSWAIRWYASAFLAEKLTLYPGYSLVRNIGLDGSGTHHENTNNFLVSEIQKPIEIKPIPIQESNSARRAFEDYFLSLQSKNLRCFLRKLMKRLL